MVKEIENTIKNYEKIADRYFEEHNDINKVQKNLDLFISYLQGNKILDIGCGPGRDARYLAEKNLEVVGIDLTTNLIKIASKNAPRAKFIIMDMRRLNFPERYFDGVWVWASFLHIPRKESKKTLIKFNRVLKERGILAISVKKGKGEGFIKKDEADNRFYSFYEEKEFIELLESCGFEIIKEFIEIKKSVWINVFARKIKEASK